MQTKEIELPEGLKIVNTIVSVWEGSNNRLKIPKINNSKHDIKLQKNSELGILQQIAYITQLEVKQRIPTYQLSIPTLKRKIL